MAMLKDTLTLRSDPIDESVPKVVPPTPPVPPSIVGTPLLDERFVQNLTTHATRGECEAAGGEGGLLLKGVFGYHKQTALGLRRLLLAPPPNSGAPPPPRKRKANDARRARTHARTDRVDSVGASFGCLLGNIAAYLEGRGLPRERAYVLRSIRSLLVPAAEALRHMRGDDVPHLARGMASCRVVPFQRAFLHEATEPHFARLDFKYGNSYTAIGATAALIAVFAIMSTVPAHGAHLWEQGALWKALRCADEALGYWHPSSLRMAPDHWAALAAERRAMQRACIAAHATWAHLRQADGATTTTTTAHEGMQRLIEAARSAAFPSGAVVSEFTQVALCDRLQRAHGVWSAPAAEAEAHAATAPMLVLPLAEIPDSMALVTGSAGANGRLPLGTPSTDDGHSCASSSWKTLSSNQSGFSHVSQDSLSGLGVSDLSVT